jgi:hypothetical protein
MPATLERLLATVRNVDTVIPGHMAVSTWASLAEFTAFNRELLGTARAAKAAGRTVEQALDELANGRFRGYVTNTPLAGLAFLGTARDRARINIDLVYKAAQ